MWLTLLQNRYNIASQNYPCISLTWNMARERYIKQLSLNGKVANQCVMNTWMGFIHLEILIKVYNNLKAIIWLSQDEKVHFY